MPVSTCSTASRVVRAAPAAALQAAISPRLFSAGVRRCDSSAGTASGGAPSSTKMRASGSSARNCTPSSSRATKKLSQPIADNAGATRAAPSP